MSDWLKEVIDVVGWVAVVVMAFRFGGFHTNLKQMNETLVTFCNDVLRHDDRIQALEQTKLDKSEFFEFEKDYVKLRTEHDIHHKEK